MRAPRSTFFVRLLVGMAGVLSGSALGLGAVHLLRFADVTSGVADHAAASNATPGADPSGEGRRGNGAPTTARKPRTPPEALPALVSRYAYPPEPEAPPHLDLERFRDAFELLCRERGSAAVVRDVLAPAILEQALTWSSDPFLMAALVSRRGCRDRGDGLGFTGLVPELYASSIRRGEYRYAAYVDGRFEPTTLDLSAYRFEDAVLRTPAGHFYFASAFLRAWSQQDRGLDVAFVQAQHRHYVSHYLWGDQVGSARQEMWVLVERRRILEYYDAIEPRPPVEYRGVRLGSPLDGAPRLVVSGLGEPRGNGTRPHRGVDYESTVGEPVRAIADGVVVFSGIDLPGTLHRTIDIDTQTDVDLEEMGHGGFYVCVEHGGGEQTLKSCYMHLQRLSVRQGRVVRQGEEIGQVGSTGSSSMGPHLHFEIHVREGPQPATEVLTGLALGRTRTTFSGPSGATPPP